MITNKIPGIHANKIYQDKFQRFFTTKVNNILRNKPIIGPRNKS